MRRDSGICAVARYTVIGNEAMAKLDFSLIVLCGAHFSLGV